MQRQPGEQKILKKNKVCLHEKAPGKFKKTPDPSDQSTWLSLVHWVSFTTVVCVNYKGNLCLRIMLLLVISVIKRVKKRIILLIKWHNMLECFLIWWQVWTNSSLIFKCLQFQAQNRVRLLSFNTLKYHWEILEMSWLYVWEGFSSAWLNSACLVYILMGSKNKLQDEYVAAQCLILLAPCYTTVQFTFSWNRKTFKSNVLLSGTNSHDADSSQGYAITSESESNTSSKLHNTRQEATHVKTFTRWCWSSLWKVSQTRLNCDSTCFNQRRFNIFFLCKLNTKCSLLPYEDRKIRSLNVHFRLASLLT